MQLRTLQRYALLSATLVCLGASPLCGQDTDTPSAMPEAMTPTAFNNPDLVKQYQATITPAELSAHLYFFASDFFEGRDTGQRGQKMAAHYLAAQYRRMGVAPSGTVEPTSDASASEIEIEIREPG